MHAIVIYLLIKSAGFSRIFRSRLLQFAIVIAAGLACGNALAVPRGSAVPGGLLIVDLGSRTVIPDRPQVKFQQKKVLVTGVSGNWKAFAGIPLSTRPGKQRLSINYPGRSVSLPFLVSKKRYPEQRIKLKNKGQVNLSPENAHRATTEKAELDTHKQHWRDISDVPLTFIAPVSGRLSSRFGLRRYFNGQPRSPHSGLDFAVAAGTPIKAPAAAEVLAIGRYFFTGNTVMLDHGQGLITLYAHLSKTAVKPGDRIQQGQTLGHAGATGRATGTHLHWSVILNGTTVDPELFLADLPSR